MRDAVAQARGAHFAARHIRDTRGGLHADLSGMNLELLSLAGVPEESIDISDECTYCLTEKYHSHRRTHGIRGAMGTAVAILSDES